MGRGKAVNQQVAFIDVEATGLRRGSYPIEVGVALVLEGALAKSDAWLVRPCPEWERDGLAWEPEAVSMTGLTPKFVGEFGMPAKEVCERLEAVIGETGEVFCDGLPCDDVWMRKLYRGADRRMPFDLRDVQELRRLAAKMSADRARALWEAKVAQVDAEVSLERHRAGPDAERLARAYLKLEPSAARPSFR